MLSSDHGPQAVRGVARAIPLLVQIRAIVPSRPPAERRVAAVVLEDPAAASALTISELAQTASTSETTVIRFCKALGLAGYPQLRLALAATGPGPSSGTVRVGSDIGPADSLEQVVAKVGYADARAVEETSQSLDTEVLGAVVAAMLDAERVDLYGVGASAFVALDLQQKLHRVRRVAFAWSDPHIALTSAALLRPGDVAIGISHRGTTTETVEALELAGRGGATTVAVTNFPLSPLAETATHVLTTAARETTYRSGATVSRIAALTVVDCLFVGLAQRLLPDAGLDLDATYQSVQGHQLATRRPGNGTRGPR